MSMVIKYKESPESPDFTLMLMDTDPKFLSERVDLLMMLSASGCHAVL